MLLVETLLGTLLVWWWVGEVPTRLAFVGGGMIVATLLLSGLRDLHRQRRKAAAGAPDVQRLHEVAAAESIQRDEPAPPMGERH